MPHCPFIPANNTEHKAREHFNWVTSYLGNKAKCVQLPVLSNQSHFWTRKREKITFRAETVRSVKHWLTPVSLQKLNFKHDWTEWLCVSEGSSFLARSSIQQTVKGADPLSDLRSCDGTLHTNGTALLFFRLNMCQQLVQGRLRVWNIAILVLESLRKSTPVPPTRIYHFSVFMPRFKRKLNWRAAQRLPIQATAK